MDEGELLKPQRAERGGGSAAPRFFARLAAGAALITALAAPADAAATFALTDPKGDDHGTGELLYPNRPDLQKGDLDLVSFSATAAGDGTWFAVEFARPIRSPRGAVTAVGQVPLEQLARHGFYTFNVDVYIDTDRVIGSGNLGTVPGRGVDVAREFAWEKAVILTPRPDVGGSLLESRLVQQAEEEMRSRVGRVSAHQFDFLSGRIRGEQSERYFFPDRIRVSGRRIEFFVPKDFLPAGASASFGYTVIVTGADVEQVGAPVLLASPVNSLMAMGVSRGVTAEAFGIRGNVDAATPPVVDVLAARPGEQEKYLDDYDAVSRRLPALPGIAPDGKPATTPSGHVASAADARRVDSVLRPDLRSEGAPPRPRVTAGGGSATRSVAERLREINQLLADGLITAEEHAELRRRILAEL